MGIHEVHVNWLCWQTHHLLLAGRRCQHNFRLSRLASNGYGTLTQECPEGQQRQTKAEENSCEKTKKREKPCVEGTLCR